ncbi:MAG: hypothetical protein U0R70_07010 [Solirubrobacteraceae bacterium]
MTRPEWAAAAVCLAAVALGPGVRAARGDVRAAAAGVSPGVAAYPQANGVTWVTFKLRLRTGDREERFAVSVRGARFGGGSVLGRPEPLTFSGPARLTFADTTWSLTTCSPAPLVIRQGVEPVRLTQYVALGARSDVVVSARLPVAAAPWPGSRLQAVFTIAPRFVDDGGGAGPTGVTPQTILSAVPRARLSRSGVRITLAGSPRLGAVGPRDPYGRAFPRYRLGRTFAISGRTEPALPGPGSACASSGRAAGSRPSPRCGPGRRDASRSAGARARRGGTSSSPSSRAPNPRAPARSPAPCTH